MTDVQKTFIQDSHLQVCLLRHNDRRHSEEARATYWDVKLPVLRKGECRKSQHLLGREFTCEDWSHCLHRRSFKSLNWSIFLQSEDHKRIIPSRMMNYAKIPYKSTIHLYRGSSTRSLLCYRSWTRSKSKESKEVVRGVYTLVQKEDTYFLYNGRCAICLDNDANEAEIQKIEEGESSNSSTT